MAEKVRKIVEKKYSFDLIVDMEARRNIQAYRSDYFVEPPIVLERGEGVFVWDVNGRKYLDFSAQFSACNIGHGNNEMIDAIVKQLRTNQTNISPAYITKSRVMLAEVMAELTEGKLSKSWFGATGSDAVEATLKFARKYTRKYKFVSLWRGYHGATLGALSAHGIWETRNDYGPLLTGFVHVSPPFCYRCDFDLDYPECDLTCLKVLEKTIEREGPEHVAGVIVEPIPAGGGVIVPPDRYLPELRKICDRKRVLLILDEVVTGFGRTGRIFCYQHYDIVPDFLVLGKGITSGYIPGSAVLASGELDIYDPDSPTETLHWHTHCANPLMCAAAIISANIILRENLPENATKVGRFFLKGLLDLAEESKGLGDARGKGLLHGLEIVEDKESRKPSFPKMEKIARECVKNGLIVETCGGTDIAVIVFHPPLNISEEHAQSALDILGKAVRWAE